MPALADNCNSSVDSALTLTGNVNATGNASCFIITGNNAVLDCAGHTIYGILASKGVYVNGYRNVVVKNCVLTGLTKAIHVEGDGADNGVYYNNTAWGNLNYGFQLTAGDANNVSYNNFSYNSMYGIDVYDASTENNVFAFNTLTGNTQYGLFFETGTSYNNISYNTITYNGYHGIYFQENNGYNNLTGNFIRSTGSSSYDCINFAGDGVDSNTVDYNTLYECRGSGVVVAGGDWNVFSSNNISSAGNNSVQLSSSATYNIFQHNTLYNASSSTGGNVVISSDTADYNRFYNNTVWGAALCGFRLRYPDYLNVSYNNISYSNSYGLNLYDSVTQGNFTGNTIHNNSGHSAVYFNGETADSNTLDYNSFYANQVAVHADSADYVNVSYNNFSYNVHEGLVLSGASTFWNITNNLFHNNSLAWNGDWLGFAGVQRAPRLRDASAMISGLKRAFRAASLGGGSTSPQDFDAVRFFVTASSNTFAYNTVEGHASGVYVEWSNYLNISYNDFNSSYFSIRMSTSTGGVVQNNTFRDGVSALNFSGAVSTTVYHNLFYNATEYFAVDEDGLGSVLMSADIGGVQQGNYYADILDYDIYDTDGDGYANGGTQYPYTSSVSTRFVDPFGSLADQGPITSNLYVSCGNVAANLTLPNDVDATAVPGDCFLITDHNIVLDCAGHSIIGGGPGWSGEVAGVTVIDKRHFTLKNCVITNFDYAVNVSGTLSDDGVYYNNTLLNNYWGFFFLGGDSNNVSYNNASLNANANLYAYSFYAAMDANNFTHNQFDYSPGGNGIAVSMDAGNTITNFLVYDNNASYNSGGAYLTGDYQNFSYNNISYNSGTGLYLDDGSGTAPITYSNISGNSLTGNAGYGFFFAANGDAIYNNTVSFNQIVSNAGGGAYLAGLDANNFSYNNFSGNGVGLLLDNAADGNYFQNNTLTEDLGWNSTNPGWSADSVNNIVFHNAFYGGALAFVENGHASNQFNTTVAGVPQGNYYDDILSYAIYDSDADGYGDSGSDYPYSAASSSKWTGVGGDYGPATDKAAPLGCQNLAANLTLTADVDATGYTNCFNVTAHNLALDCNGYTIRGAGGDYGVYNNGYRKVNVTNCVITNFATGIYFTGDTADEGLLYNDTLHSNLRTGVRVIDGDLMNASYCNYSYNLEYGAWLSGSATLNNFTANAIQGNSLVGVLLYGDDVDENAVYANTLTGNLRGVNASLADNNNLSYNSFASNTRYAVSLESASGNLVQNNTITGDEGVRLEASTGNSVYHNFFYGGAVNFVSNADGLAADYQFNTTVAGVAQGNYYEDILSLRLYDSDGDGYGDMGSQYPYNSTNSHNWTGSGADYGPMLASFHGCKDLSSSFTLEANVFAGGFTNCFNVTADAVTLDCNGYEISGDGTGIAFNNTGYLRVKIKNCAITNFTTGILYLGDGADDGTVLHNRVWNNTADGIRFTDADGNNASYNNVSYNLQGLALSGSAENQSIRYNTLAYNSVGANYSGASYSNASDNNVSYNTVAGVRFEGAAFNNSFTNDAIADASGASVQSAAGGYNVFLNSTFNKSAVAVTGGNITVKWYVSLSIRDELGNAVYGYLNVSNSTLLMSSTSARSNGDVTGIADEYLQNSTDTVNYTDQTLTVYGRGLLTGQWYYPSNSTTYTVDQASWPENMTLALCGNGYCYSGVEDSSNCALDCHGGGGGGGGSHPDPTPSAEPTAAPTTPPDTGGSGSSYNATPTPSPTAEPCETITETVTQGDAQCVEGVEQVLEVTRRIVVMEDEGKWVTTVALEITNLGGEGVENARITEELPAGLTSDQVLFVVAPDEDYGSSVAWVITWLAPNAKAYLEYRADRLIQPDAFKEPGVGFQGTRSASVYEWLSTWGALNWLLAGALVLELAYAWRKLASKKNKKKKEENKGKAVQQ